jgi:hypothetical protein
MRINRGMQTAGNREDFLWDFIYDYEFGGSQKDTAEVFEAAARHAITPEELRDQYLGWALKRMRVNPIIVEAHDLARLQRFVDELKFYGPISEDVLVQFLPVFRQTTAVLLEDGRIAPKDLEGLIETFRPVLPEGFEAGVKKHEKRYAETDVMLYAISGRSRDIINALKTLRSLGSLTTDLEDAVRVAATDGLGNPPRGFGFDTTRDGDHLNVLKEVGWQDKIDDVYGAVLCGIAKSRPQMLKVMQALDSQNTMPDHLAALIMLQLEGTPNYADKKAAFEFAGTRAHKPTPELAARAKKSLENIIISRLERRENLPNLPAGHSYAYGAAPVLRLGPQPMTQLIELYKDIFRQPVPEAVREKTKGLIEYALNHKMFKEACSLASAAYGNNSKIPVEPFDNRARAIYLERLEIISRAGGRSNMSGGYGDALRQLGELATELTSMEQMFGGKLTNGLARAITTSAIQLNQASVQPYRHQELVVESLCMLLDKYVVLYRQSPAPSIPTEDLSAAKESLATNYTRIKHYSGFGRGPSRKLAEKIERAHLILYGEQIKERAPAPRFALPQRSHSRYGSRMPEIAAPKPVVPEFSNSPRLTYAKKQ